MEDFIRQYDNVLDEELMGHLLALINNNINYNVRSDTTRQDKQLALEPFWPELATDINPLQIQHCCGLVHGLINIEVILLLVVTSTF